jgi:hypothetical protein
MNRGAEVTVIFADFFNSTAGGPSTTPVAVIVTACGPVEVGPATKTALASPLSSVVPSAPSSRPPLGSTAENATGMPLTGLSLTSRT